MIDELDDAFWNDLVTRIGWGEVIPVVGPGAVTLDSATSFFSRARATTVCRARTKKPKFLAQVTEPQLVAHAGESRETQLARTEAISRLASIRRHDRTIIRIIPPMVAATLKSIKRTLHEKPALIPLTPEAPATFEGSLHPGHAIREGTKFIQNRLSHINERSTAAISIISRSRARGFRDQSGVFAPPPQMSHRSTLELRLLHQREQKLSFQNEWVRCRMFSPALEIQ